MYFEGWWISGSLVDFWDSHSGSFGWKARIVSALSVPIGGENDRLRWLPNRYVFFFAPELNMIQANTFWFRFYIQHAVRKHSMTVCWVQLVLISSWCNFLYDFKTRWAIFLLTLPGVQDEYSNLQKHAAAVSHWKSRVQEPYLDFFDLRHLLVPGVFRWTSSEGRGEDGRSKSILHSFSCHILENIGPKAFVFFFWGSNQTSFLSKNVRVSTFPSFEVLGT